MMLRMTSWGANGWMKDEERRYIYGPSNVLGLCTFLAVPSPEIAPAREPPGRTGPMPTWDVRGSLEEEVIWLEGTNHLPRSR